MFSESRSFGAIRQPGKTELTSEWRTERKALAGK